MNKKDFVLYVPTGLILAAIGFFVAWWFQPQKPPPPPKYADHPCAYVGKEIIYDAPARWARWAHDIKTGKADAAEIAKLDCELDYVSKVWSR